MISRILITLFCMITASPLLAAHIQAFDTASIYDLQSMAQVTGSTGKWTHTGPDSSFSEVSDTVEQVHARQILVETEDAAQSESLHARRDARVEDIYDTRGLVYCNIGGF